MLESLSWGLFLEKSRKLRSRITMNLSGKQLFLYFRNCQLKEMLNLNYKYKQQTKVVLAGCDSVSDRNHNFLLITVVLQISQNSMYTAHYFEIVSFHIIYYKITHDYILSSIMLYSLPLCNVINC